MQTVLKNISFPAGKRGSILIEKGYIADIVQGTVKPQSAEIIDGRGLLVLPGLIDLHIHGASGCDLMDGKITSFQKISGKLAETGCTGFLPTSVSADIDSIVAFIDAAIAVHGNEKGAKILGIHLEGPFLNSKRKGMQNEKHLLLPDLDLMSMLFRRSLGLLKMVTLAPELEGGLDLVRFLKRKGVVVAIGHSNANEKEARRAFLGGAKHITHFYNAMPPFHHRNPGLIGAALDDPNVTMQVILDGHHVSSTAFWLLYKLKGPSKIALITDAMQAMGVGDGDYEFGGHKVKVEEGVARLIDGTLASSTLSLNEAIRNCVKMGVKIEDAIAMATKTPSQILGLSDKGRLSKGQTADLILVDKEFNVKMTMLGGKIYKPF